MQQLNSIACEICHFSKIQYFKMSNTSYLSSSWAVLSCAMYLLHETDVSPSRLPVLSNWIHISHSVCDLGYHNSRYQKKKNAINKRITFFHVNVTRPMYSPKYGNKSRTREQISMNQSNLSELKLPPESIIFFRFPLALMTSFIYDMSSIVNTLHRPPR